jgi:hypothetical protein
MYIHIVEEVDIHMDMEDNDLDIPHNEVGIHDNMGTLVVHKRHHIMGKLLQVLMVVLNQDNDVVHLE